MASQTDPPPAAPSLTEAGEPNPTVSWSWGTRIGLITGLVGAVLVILIVTTSVNGVRLEQAEQEALVAFKGLDKQTKRSLDARCRDDDNDLIADPPTNTADLISPQPLELVHYPGDDDGILRVDWKRFQRELAEATGREIEVQPYLNTPEELEAIAVGKIQLVAVHSAEVPKLVNAAGLVPFAELAEGNATDGNRLVIAVGPQSKAESLEALRGKTLVCTEPDSLTGYRAAIVAIFQETGMRPGTDYEVYYSRKHERSVRGVSMGKFPFIALSNDVLARMLQQGQVKESDYRVIYESEPIPRLTVGYVSRLAPDLAERVRSMVLDYKSKESSPYQFRTIDYQQEYDFVRRLDDAFEPRFGQAFVLEDRM